MKSYMADANNTTRQWYVINATGKTLGRLATFVATRLSGKHKPEFTPHSDTGDFIIITHVEGLAVTGKKLSDKIYHRHSNYPGGITSTPFVDMQKKHPGRALEIAVKGMLPKGPLGRAMFRKLKIYKGSEHPHEAQQPQSIEV